MEAWEHGSMGAWGHGMGEINSLFSHSSPSSPFSPSSPSSYKKHPSQQFVSLGKLTGRNL
jgi:hypothetical protein